MRLYLDASVLVASLTGDHLADRASILLASVAGDLIVSDYARAEFASVISRRVRVGEFTHAEARVAFANLDAWCDRLSLPAHTTSADVQTAAAFMRRLDLPLRTPDALNLAIARRIGASIATFDAKMADSARVLGLAVAA